MKRKLLLLFLIFFPITSLATSDNFDNAIRKNPLPGTVALTFDDGPSPYTPQVLAILKKYHIKATFFVVGTNAKKYPEYVKAIYDQGHVVASHSQTHPMLTKLKDDELKKEIATPSEIVNHVIGVKPKCLRYPFGASNQQVRDEIRAYGMMPVPMG